MQFDGSAELGLPPSSAPLTHTLLKIKFYAGIWIQTTHQVIVDNVPWFGRGRKTGGLVQDGAVGDSLLSGNYLGHFHFFVFFFRVLYFLINCLLSLCHLFIYLLFKFILHFLTGANTFVTFTFTCLSSISNFLISTHSRWSESDLKNHFFFRSLPYTFVSCFEVDSLL